MPPAPTINLRQLRSSPRNVNWFHKKAKSSDSLRRIDSTPFGRASQVLAAARLISRQIGPCALIHNRSVRLPGVVLHRPSITNVLESIWLASLWGGLEVIRSASQLEQHPQFVLSERLSVYETTRKGILYTVCSVCDVFRSNTSWPSKTYPRLQSGRGSHRSFLPFSLLL